MKTLASMSCFHSMQLAKIADIPFWPLFYFLLFKKGSKENFFQLVLINFYLARSMSSYTSSEGKNVARPLSGLGSRLLAHFFTQSVR